MANWFPLSSIVWKNTANCHLKTKLGLSEATVRLLFLEIGQKQERWNFAMLQFGITQMVRIFSRLSTVPLRLVSVLQLSAGRAAERAR